MSYFREQKVLEEKHLGPNRVLTGFGENPKGFGIRKNKPLEIRYKILRGAVCNLQ